MSALTSLRNRAIRRVTRLAAYVIMPKFTTGAIVVARDGDRVILVRKRTGGVEWGFPAGYLFYGEDLARAAARELREETGVEVDLGPQHHVRSYRQPWILHIDHVFVVAATGGPEVGDGLEIAAARWFTRDDLPPLAREARLVLEEVPDALTRPVDGHSNRLASPAP